LALSTACVEELQNHLKHSKRTGQKHRRAVPPWQKCSIANHQAGGKT